MDQPTLVYLQDSAPLLPCDNRATLRDGGTTYLVSSYRSISGWTFSGQFDYDAYGYPLEIPITIEFPLDSIVSNRHLKKITPALFYSFSPSKLTATNFTDTTNRENPLEEVSRFGWGSGIIGTYCRSRDFALSLAGKDLVYPLVCSHPLVVQDQEHGESITNASMQTNSYLQPLLKRLRTEKISSSELTSYLSEDPSVDALMILWRIVFARVEGRPVCSKKKLVSLLVSYLQDYWINEDIIDSNTGNFLRPLPINYLLTSLGYDSLLANDPYSNGWGRGCVHFDHLLASRWECGKRYY